MSDSPWNSQGVRQNCISGIDRLIYHHSDYRDNILTCFSQGYDFWYQASHCFEHLVKTSDFAGLFLPKDARIVVKTSLWNSNIPIFIFCRVGKRFHAFAIEVCTTHAKKIRHHFFDLIQTKYINTNWSNRSTTSICLF